MIKKWIESEANNLVNDIVKINDSELLEHKLSGFGMKNKVIEIIKEINACFFPSIYESHAIDEEYIEIYVKKRINAIAVKLNGIIREVFVNMCHDDKNNMNACDHCKNKADAITIKFMNSLGKIRRILSTDIVAAYNGDPAAKSLEEILLSYPCIEAITIQRVAHELFELNVPFIPRIMTEYAHSQTGIDIHPGAKIGEYFFIDHATGVVIGETCVIGNNVKLYQGVTLGAKSFELDIDGNPIKGIKRHPNIEDNVVIYAGATILGGDTTIGEGSIIGGNVWLTKSVPKFSMVYNNTPDFDIKRMKKENS